MTELNYVLTWNEVTSDKPILITLLELEYLQKKRVKISGIDMNLTCSTCY